MKHGTNSTQPLEETELGIYVRVAKDIPQEEYKTIDNYGEAFEKDFCSLVESIKNMFENIY
jgi:hypothetical protein